MKSLRSRWSSSNKNEVLERLLLGLLLGLLAVYSFLSIEQIPFHPDESTQLFMSGDFEAWLSRPLSLSWSPFAEENLKQHYRELDAPLTRYLLGLGRSLSGLPSPSVDWDWGKNWEENRQSGALPDRRLLYAGRLAVTILLPVSLLLTFLTGKQLGGAACGLLSMLFMGTNALVLLHARRAMAEGALLFGISLFLWSLPKASRYPWLAGLAAAVAFNAKQSALALFPLGLLAAGWISAETRHKGRSTISRAVQFTLTFTLVSIAVNPLWWSSPVQAVKASWKARQELLTRQVAETKKVMPGQVLQTPGERIAITLANVYILPPAFAEIGNYRAETAAAESAYLSMPGNNLLRGMAGGGLLLFLTICGLFLAVLHLRRPDRVMRRSLILLFLANLSQAAVLLFAVPLSWQRYIIPLIPFSCIWAAYSANCFLKAVFPMSAVILKDYSQ